MNTELEIKMFKYIMNKNRRDRFVWHVSSEKRRDKIFADLRDDRHFDKSKTSQVDHPETIVKFLKKHKVSRGIYIISDDYEIDGRTVSIDQLEKDDFWRGEEIIGFSHVAKVGFFKNHEEWYYTIK